jgi:hypothetical protein
MEGHQISRSSFLTDSLFDSSTTSQLLTPDSVVTTVHVGEVIVETSIIAVIASLAAFIAALWIIKDLLDR